MELMVLFYYIGLEDVLLFIEVMDVVVEVFLIILVFNGFDLEYW